MTLPTMQEAVRIATATGFCPCCGVPLFTILACYLHRCPR